MNPRALLVVRGALGLLFAGYLIMAPATAGHNGYYGFVDGIVGLLLAFALSKEPSTRWLFGLTLADALVRLVTGIVVFAYPDLEARVMSAVAFYGALITACIVLGVVGILIVLVKRRVVPERLRAGTTTTLVASALTLLFGLALMLGFSAGDGRRMLVGVFALGLGLTYLVTGLRLKLP